MYSRLVPATVAILMSSTAIAQPAAPTAQAATANPLLATWTGPYRGVPPWDRVKPELFSEAIAAGLQERREEYDGIAQNPAKPTFANTFVPMQNAGERLSRVTTLFNVMTGNMNTPAY